MNGNEVEKIMVLSNENKELKFRVDELRKNFMTLKVEMDIQQEHLKRVMELNKLLVPKLDIENIASSFFNYLKDVLGYDKCGIIVRNEKYFFLNDINENHLELQMTLHEAKTEEVVTYLFNEVKSTRLPVILDKEKANKVTDSKVNSLIALPLINHEEILGMIILESEVENVYTDKELNLILELTNSLPEIIENAIHFSEVNQIAIKDPSTHLYNKDYFNAHIGKKYIETKHPFSVIFMDVTTLKRVNTLYGNETEDKIIQEIGKILRIFAHKKYIVSRYDGGKFAILLPNHSLDKSKKIAKKICHYLLEKNILNLDIEYAFGIASSIEESEPDKDTILKNADNALHSAKIIGKNQIVCFKYSD